MRKNTKCRLAVILTGKDRINLKSMIYVIATHFFVFPKKAWRKKKERYGKDGREIDTRRRKRVD